MWQGLRAEGGVGGGGVQTEDCIVTVGGLRRQATGAASGGGRVPLNTLVILQRKTPKS